MESLKRYFSKTTILLIAIGSMVFLYWYGFHKNFDQEGIPQNADGIAMVDVKNIQNYLVFSFLKNPSEWKWDTTSFEFKKRFNLSQFGINIPDYLAFFHIDNQPISQWFVTLKIDDEVLFEKVIAKEHFSKTILQSGMNFYYSNAKMLLIIKHSNQILVANVSEKQKQIAIKVAEDLFFRKLFLDFKAIEKTIDTNNAVTFWIKKNSLLKEDGILNLKLEDQEITVDGQLKLNFKKESQFSQNPNALLFLGFDFEMIRKHNFLKRNSVKINKVIGFDLDSILVNNPTKTELLLNEIVEKKDSAISYDYDDDFNPIKKVVVHSSREPSFYFSMQTANSKKVFNYLKAKNAIDNHNVFVNFPLAKTQTSIQNNALTLEANPLKNRVFQTSSPKIGYLQIHFNKLHPKDWHYVIDKNQSFRFLKPFEVLTIELSSKNNSGFFQARLKAKDGKSLISVMM